MRKTFEDSDDWFLFPKTSKNTLASLEIGFLYQKQGEAKKEKEKDEKF